MIDKKNFKWLVYEFTSDMLEKNETVEALTSSVSILKEMKQKKKNLSKISCKKDEIINY